MGRKDLVSQQQGSTMTVRPSTAEVLATENYRLRKAVEAAEERARLAEEQLMRVHRAVRAAQQNLKNARQKRNDMLREAQQQASQLVGQAQTEAERIMRIASQGSALAQSKTPSPSLMGGHGHHWGENDPTLDERLEQYLETVLPPDASREWILGERAD